MIIKEHDSNCYVSIHKRDFPNHSHYYQEIMRIQFNKVYSYQNSVEIINTKLLSHDKTKNKK